MLQWDDAAYTQLMKAKHADMYVYTRETVSEYPDFTSPDVLEHGPKVTDANPQQKDFLWTKGVRLVDYTSTRGEKLQAALYLPANYEAGKSYPDDGVDLREGIAESPTIIRSRAITASTSRLHQQRLRGAGAGYRLQGERSGHVRRWLAWCRR